MKRIHVRYVVMSGLLVLPWLACSGDRQRATAEQPIRVEAARVQTAGSQQSFAYSGTIEASESIPLSFATVGNVAAVLVAEGDAVHKGQLLAALNDESSRNAYEMALATQKQAEDAYNRLLPMYKSGNLAEIKWVEMETNLQKARSAAAISKKNLDDCKLHAPVSGIVGKRAIEPGMAAMPNLASITIVKIAKVFARISVSENEISRLRKGQMTRVTIGALQGQAFNGAVEEIGVVADALAHAYKVRISVQNPSGLIKPGMICSVSIEDEQPRRSLVVPGPAVLVDEMGRRFVYVVQDENRAVRRQVQTGALLQNGIEIVSGLSSDEWVVSAGQHKLVDNASVLIINR